MKKTLLWLTIDVVLVLLFAFQGRSTHSSGNGLLGLVETAWPFLAGLALGWIFTRQWQTTDGGLPMVFQLWPSSIALVFITWMGGLAFRSISGHTNEGGFPLVALGFFLLMLVGWRIVWGSIIRIRQQNPQEQPADQLPV